ncbi:organoarsenical effux MFS transporter ArsJ [Thalassotalea montiporae]
MLNKLRTLSSEVKQYLVITANYWAFTLTDGALRMLVVLYFHQLGYSPLAIAMLFLFYEFFGVVTNLIGGWLGARIGLNRTMQIGLVLQVAALAMLAVPDQYLTVVLVMAAQALSGIAKDLNKMSAKSSIKALIPKGSAQNGQHGTSFEGKLFKWVALLTGSKNTLKGIGFFLGGALLTLLGFQSAMLAMASALFLVVIASQLLLKKDLGKAKNKPKFNDIFSKSAPLNYLSAARLCLFAARDVWFVVAIPVFFVSELAWQHHHVGLFMALWVIGYGIVQALSPKLVNLSNKPVHAVASQWGGILTLSVIALMFALNSELSATWVLVIGLLLFGAVFAINSAVHSYAIVALAKEDGVSIDVGFYYMANAMGRLLGTIFSGLMYQQYGLMACLVASSVLAGLAALLVTQVKVADEAVTA